MTEILLRRPVRGSPWANAMMMMLIDRSGHLSAKLVVIMQQGNCQADMAKGQTAVNMWMTIHMNRAHENDSAQEQRMKQKQNRTEANTASVLDPVNCVNTHTMPGVQSGKAHA